MTLDQEMFIGRKLVPISLLVIGYFLYRLFKKKKGVDKIVVQEGKY